MEQVRICLRQPVKTSYKQYPGHPAPQSGLRIGLQSFAVCIIVGKRTCWYCTVRGTSCSSYISKSTMSPGREASLRTSLLRFVPEPLVSGATRGARASYMCLRSCARRAIAHRSRMQRARGRAELAGHLPCVVPLSGSVEANHQREMPCEKGSIPRSPRRRTVHTVSSSCWAFVLPTACPPPGVLLAVAAPHVFQHEGGPQASRLHEVEPRGSETAWGARTVPWGECRTCRLS